VDAGAKKSSRNSSEKNIEISGRSIKLHYFPDIPVGESSGNRRCESSKNRFKRVHFDQANSFCLDRNQNVKEDTVSITTSSIKEIEHQAYQKGFLEGQKAGIESRAGQIDSMLGILRQTLIQAQKLQKEIYLTVEKEVVALVLAIARKVVCQEVTTNKDVVLCVAKEALSKVRVPGEITVKLNPFDLEVINDTKRPMSYFRNHIENVTFQPEETISRGGCVIETNMGTIDARLEKQFRVIEEMFQAEMLKSTQSIPEET
jgi:flagellar assembly protein FliH